MELRSNYASRDRLATATNATAEKTTSGLPRFTDGLNRAELILAISVTCLALGSQISFLLNAGGLWRDETNSINLATSSDASRIWQHLDGDSFPMLWFLILRAWAMLGLANTDIGIRSLALSIAIGVYVAVWLLARELKFRYALFTIAIIGLNPVVVRTLGSNRAYGLGVLTVLLAYIAVWKLLSNPRRRTVVSGVLFALFAVHSVYYNILFVTAIIAAGMLVAYRNKWFDRIRVLALIEVVCLISLLPYIVTIQKQHQWSGIVSTSVGLADVWSGLCSALGSPLELMSWFWVEFAALCAVVTIVRVAFKLRRGEVSRISDQTIFVGVSFAIGFVLLFTFLMALQYIVRPWYFVGLIPLIGLMIDSVILHRSEINSVVRTCTAGLAFALIAFSVGPASPAISVRRTNTDLVAEDLLRRATPADYIVVEPWYFGVSFDRYYKGSADWDTAPHVRFIKYDFVRVIAEKMASNRPLDSVMSRIGTTLQNGGRVFVVGDPILMDYGEQPEPPAMTRPSGNWQLKDFLHSWAGQVHRALRQQGRITARYSLSGGRGVDIEECATVEIWQPRKHYRTQKTLL